MRLHPHQRARGPIPDRVWSGSAPATREPPVERLLARLQDVRPSGSGWVARCPSHEDRSPSLSISEGDDGRALVYCHAGCWTERVASAVGLGLPDLFVGRRCPRAVSPILPESYLARRKILLEARRQMRRLAPYREANADADCLKAMDRTVAAARRTVTALGEDDPRAWDLAEQAAGLERETLAMEAT